MGACGCISGNQAFKLKAPDGWYVIEFMQGCDYCCHGPGVQIHHPEAVKYLDDVEYMPDLPVIGDDEHCITMIKCGPNMSEAENAAVKCFTGSETENNCVDEVLAEILGEDFWRDTLSDPPLIIH